MAMMHYDAYRSPLQSLGGYGRRVPILELLVPMCCSKCQEKVRENMLELRGVQSVFADHTSQRVIVHGFVDPLKALKKAKKVKRDSQIWTSGAAPPLEYHLPSKYRRSEYHPSLYRTSSYERRVPSSVYRTSSLERHHRIPSVYRASYNQYTPSYGTQSFIHRPAQALFECSAYIDDPYSHVITNPHYVKHIESEYW